MRTNTDAHVSRNATIRATGKEQSTPSNFQYQLQEIKDLSSRAVPRAPFLPSLFNSIGNKELHL